MGRYWSITTESGITCEGKFWFGCQSSDDFENIGFIETDVRDCYYNCGNHCPFTLTEDSRIEDSNDWCSNCFDSREEHLEYLKENDESNSACGRGGFTGAQPQYMYEECDNFTNYILPKSEYNLIDEWIDNFEDFQEEGFDEHIVNFKSILVKDELKYDFDCVGLDNYESCYGEAKLSARYLLALIVRELIKLDCGEIKVNCEF